MNLCLVYLHDLYATHCPPNRDCAICLNMAIVASSLLFMALILSDIADRLSAS